MNVLLLWVLEVTGKSENMMPVLNEALSAVSSDECRQKGKKGKKLEHKQGPNLFF